MKSLVFSIFIGLISSGYGQQKVDNVILITMDGLRWQELFGGAVDSMMRNEELTPGGEEMLAKYSAPTREEARKKLMPWFWSYIAEQGQLRGNRWHDSKVDCSNRFWFSYPGYNEILTGYSDPRIDSNAKKPNPNKTILEILNEMPEFYSKVAAFGSWDVFPFIINEDRSEVPVNAGFSKADDEYLTIKEQILNELIDEIPSPWGSVRHDAFTHHYALEYMKKHHPRVVYISYGETDDFAHDGRYDHYLNSAHQTDQWIKEVWEFLQNDPFYKNKTSIIITTDHGRGTTPMEEWKSHGTIYKGSNQIWIAAFGPNVQALGEVKKEEQLFQNQVARTVMQLLGYKYNGGAYEAGEMIPELINE